MFRIIGFRFRKESLRFYDRTLGWSTINQGCWSGSECQTEKRQGLDPSRMTQIMSFLFKIIIFLLFRSVKIIRFKIVERKEVPLFFGSYQINSFRRTAILMQIIRLMKWKTEIQSRENYRK